MSKVGKILKIKKKIIGLTAKKQKNFAHIVILPGMYLITDAILDANNEDIFLEILCKEKPVLIRVYKSMDNEILSLVTPI